MNNKLLIVYVVFLVFITTGRIFAAEEGMPQLNPEFWISQISWLIIIFISLYTILSKLILPKISEVLETRKSQILSNLDDAEKFKKESELNLKKYETILNNVKNQSNLILSNTRKNINEDINNKKEQLEKNIKKEIKKVEADIKVFKENAITNINKIAIETSSNLIKNIINVDVNKSNVSAIVEDISKKQTKKYI